MARVSLLDPADLPEEYRNLLYVSDAFETTADVFRALANNPDLLRSFRRYYGVLWTDAGLTAREREIVILATARASGSAYEWHQHVRLGREAGIDDEELVRLGQDDASGFSDREALLVRYARAVVTDTVDDELHASVSSAFDDSTVVGLTMLVAAYAGLATALSALDVTPEEPFVGWTLDGA